MAECSQKSFFSPSSTALQKNFTEEEEHFKKAVYEVVNNIENDLLSNGNTSDENAKDLKNVEFKIQSDRILKVLDMAIEKIEIAFCLPFISDNWNDNKVTDEQKMISYLCEKLGGNDGLDVSSDTSLYRQCNKCSTGFVAIETRCRNTIESSIYQLHQQRSQTRIL